MKPGRRFRRCNAPFFRAAGVALVVCGLALATLLGKPAQAEGDVRRIVSLAPSVTEILFALGVGDRVVGVSTYCDYPSEAIRLPRIGSFLSPNLELILAQEPDLVIGVPSPGNRASVESLQSLGVRVLIVSPERVESILSSIRDVADAVGVAKQGEQLERRLRGDLRRIESRVAGAELRRVLMLVGRRPLVAVGPGTYLDELLGRARAINVAAETGTEWPNIGIEFVIEKSPEVIIDAAMGSERSDATQQSFWESFAVIPAVRDGRVLAYSRMELLRPGPRVAEALQTLVRAIHPERSQTALRPDGAR